MVPSSNAGRDKKFFFSQKPPDRFWVPYSLRFNGYRGSIPGVKRPGREVNSDLLVPGVGMSGAKPLLPLYVFMVWREKTLHFLLVLFMLGLTRLCGLGLDSRE